MVKFYDVDYDEKERVGIMFHGKELEVIDPLESDREKILKPLLDKSDKTIDLLEVASAEKNYIRLFIPNFPFEELRTGEIVPVIRAINKALLAKQKK